MMPLGSRIGTGPGIANPHHIEMIVEKQDNDASVRGAAEVLFAIPTPCVIDRAASRSAADLFRAQRMSPNYVRLPKCTADAAPWTGR